MAYFDSAKNRALWQKELDGLRAEKSRRESSGFLTGGNRETKPDMEQNPHRIRITYAQLEREEYEAVRSRSAEKSQSRQMEAERSGMERGREVSI